MWRKRFDARCDATDGESNFPVEYQQHAANTIQCKCNTAMTVIWAKHPNIRTRSHSFTHSLCSFQFSHVNDGRIRAILHAHTGTVTHC